MIFRSKTPVPISKWEDIVPWCNSVHKDFAFEVNRFQILNGLCIISLSLKVYFLMEDIKKLKKQQRETDAALILQGSRIMSLKIKEKAEDDLK